MQFGTGSAHGCRLWRFTPFRRRKEVSGQKKVTNVMILMSDTGGGHRASAQALQVRHLIMPPSALPHGVVTSLRRSWLPQSKPLKLLLMAPGGFQGAVRR